MRDNEKRIERQTRDLSDPISHKVSTCTHSSKQAGRECNCGCQENGPLCTLACAPFALHRFLPSLGCKAVGAPIFFRAYFLLRISMSIIITFGKNPNNLSCQDSTVAAVDSSFLLSVGGLRVICLHMVLVSNSRFHLGLRVYLGYCLTAGSVTRLDNALFNTILFHLGL